MTSYNLGSLEQEVMDCVWQEKKVTVKDVYVFLKKRRKIAYTTVMTIMARLAEKDFLIREKVGRAYLYSPKKTKGQTAKSVVRKIVDSFVDQYGKEAITAFTDELKKHK